MNMKKSETIDDYVARLTEVVNKICTFRDKFEEAYLVKKFLRSVPPKFLHIASAIEQFADLKVMTMEEVIGRLKAYEERIGGNKENTEYVLLTQENGKQKNVATMEVIAEDEVAVVAGEGEVMDVETTRFIKRRRLTRAR